MSLLELPLGQDAVIDQVEVAGEEGALLRAMGLLPGQPIRVLRWGLLGGPIHVRVGEAAFALGRSLAAAVKVRP